MFLPSNLKDHPMANHTNTTDLKALLREAMETLAELREYAEKHLGSAASSMGLRVVMTEHYILCGRLDDAAAMLAMLDESMTLLYRSVIQLLRSTGISKFKSRCVPSARMFWVATG